MEQSNISSSQSEITSPVLNESIKEATKPKLRKNRCHFCNKKYGLIPFEYKTQGKRRILVEFNSSNLFILK